MSSHVRSFAQKASHISKPLQQKYIVVFKKDAPQDKIDEYAKNVEGSGGKITNTYSSVMKGFAAHIPEDHFKGLQADDLIDYIEPDGVMSTQ